MSREYGLCLAFFEGTVPATHNYTMSRKVCEDNHGRLANLENKDKTMWVARMIEVNTSKSWRIMKIVWVLLMAIVVVTMMIILMVVEVAAASGDDDGGGSDCLQLYTPSRTLRSASDTRPPDSLHQTLHCRFPRLSCFRSVYRE